MANMALRQTQRQSSRPTDPPKLLIGSLNIQSLKPKIQELTFELNRHNYDVMLLAGTWLRSTTPNRLLVIPG